MKEKNPQQEQLRETKTKGEKVGPRQGQRSGQLWQHRSLFPAPPLLPRSQCKGVLLNQIQCAAPVTNGTAAARVCTCWRGGNIQPLSRNHLVVRQLYVGSKLARLPFVIYCAATLCWSPSRPPPFCTWQLTNVNSEPFRLRRRELFRLEMGSLFPLGLLFHTTIYKARGGVRGGDAKTLLRSSKIRLGASNGERIPHQIFIS